MLRRGLIRAPCSTLQPTLNLAHRDRMHHARTNLNLQVAANTRGAIVLSELGYGDDTGLVQALSLYFYCMADAFGIEEGDMAGADGHPGIVT